MLTFKPGLKVVIAVAALACGITAHGQALEETGPAWLPKPAINPVPQWYEVRGGAWRVPTEMVTQMASTIRSEVDPSVRARWDAYTVQYQGALSGDARSIRLMGACETEAAAVPRLSEHFRVVADGGKCFFDAIYDPQEKRFTSLRYHGNG